MKLKIKLLHIIAARLAQANLGSKNDFANFVKKTYFDDKLKNLNKKVTSNRTKHLLIENELNEPLKKVKLLPTKDNSFFLGRTYFLPAMMDLKICLFINQYLVC